jgi:hypothetical protein
MDPNNQRRQLYVLGCPREGGTVAVLCRSSGSVPGPAYCDSKKNAMRLKTKLSNDPRGIGNHRAMEIIKSLFVYRVDDDIEPAWEPGLLWAYLPESTVKCVESQSFW